jgi:hypothetical protein
MEKNRSQEDLRMSEMGIVCNVKVYQKGQYMAEP